MSGPALVGLAVLAAACGGGSSAAAGDTAYQKMLAYSQCMRSQGEPGFPDPQSNGDLLIDGKKDHLNGALMGSASKACQHLMPKSAPLTAAQQRRLAGQALKFAACMRYPARVGPGPPRCGCQPMAGRPGAGQDCLSGEHKPACSPAPDIHTQLTRGRRGALRSTADDDARQDHPSGP